MARSDLNKEAVLKLSENLRKVSAVQSSLVNLGITSRGAQCTSNMLVYIVTSIISGFTSVRHCRGQAKYLEAKLIVCMTTID